MKKKIIEMRRKNKTPDMKGKSKYALKQEQKRKGSFTAESPFKAKEIDSEPTADLIRDMDNMIAELYQVPELEDEY